MREPGAEVVALRGDEHLGLLLEPAKRLAVNDPVAVALEGRAQRAVLVVGAQPAGTAVGTHGQGGQRRLLNRGDVGGEALRDGS